MTEIKENEVYVFNFNYIGAAKASGPNQYGNVPFYKIHEIKLVPHQSGNLMVILLPIPNAIDITDVDVSKLFSIAEASKDLVSQYVQSAYGIAVGGQMPPKGAGNLIRP